MIFRGKTLEELNKFFYITRNTKKIPVPITTDMNNIIVGWKIKKEDLNALIDNFINPIQIKNDYEDICSNMKLSPYLYQKEAIHFGLNKENALIILPCGAGKTPVGIGLCVEAYNRNLIVGKCLIVVKASLKYQWLKEVEKFSYLKAKIIETPSKCRKKAFNEQFKDCDVYILNYETLKNKDVTEKLLSNNIELIFCDEIHYSNNHKSSRAKALYQFNYAKIKVGATATPITNNPGNIFGIFNFIHQDLFKNWSNFSGNYLRYTGFGKPPKPKNQEHLKQQIKPYLLVKTIQDVADQLPSTVLNKIYCKMSSSMLEMNNRIMEELNTESRKAEAYEQKLSPKQLETCEDFLKIKSKIMALQTFAQELVDSPRLLIESDSSMSKQYYIEEESSKLERCIELVENIIDSGEKVCIFSKYERMQRILEEEICKRIKNIKVAKVNGTMSAEERYVEIYNKFRDTDEYKVLLGTDSMAEGIVCALVKLFELTENSLELNLLTIYSNVI